MELLFEQFEPYYGMAICALLLVILTWVSVRGVNGWPLNHYPMFAGQITIEEARGYRLALLNEQGQLQWWEPRFYRLPWRFHREFVTAGVAGDVAASDIQKARCDELFALAFSGLSEQERSQTVAMVLVERKTVVAEDGSFNTLDKPVLRYNKPKGY